MQTYKVKADGVTLKVTKTTTVEVTKDELEKKKEYTENRITCVTRDFDRKLLEYQTDLADIDEKLAQFGQD